MARFTATELINGWENGMDTRNLGIMSSRVKFIIRMFLLYNL